MKQKSHQKKRITEMLNKYRADHLNHIQEGCGNDDGQAKAKAALLGGDIGAEIGATPKDSPVAEDRPLDRITKMLDKYRTLPLHEISQSTPADVRQGEQANAASLELSRTDAMNAASSGQGDPQAALQATQKAQQVAMASRTLNNPTPTPVRGSSAYGAEETVGDPGAGTARREDRQSKLEELNRWTELAGVPAVGRLPSLLMEEYGTRTPQEVFDEIKYTESAEFARMMDGITEQETGFQPRLDNYEGPILYRRNRNGTLTSLTQKKGEPDATFRKRIADLRASDKYVSNKTVGKNTKAGKTSKAGSYEDHIAGGSSQIMTFNWDKWARRAEQQYELPEGSLGHYNNSDYTPSKAPAIFQYLVARPEMEDYWNESLEWGEESPFSPTGNVAAGWYGGFGKVRGAAAYRRKLIALEKRAAAGEELNKNQLNAINGVKTRLDTVNPEDLVIIERDGIPTQTEYSQHKRVHATGRLKNTQSSGGKIGTYAANVENRAKRIKDYGTTGSTVRMAITNKNGTSAKDDKEEYRGLRDHWKTKEDTGNRRMVAALEDQPKFQTRKEIAVAAQGGEEARLKNAIANQEYPGESPEFADKVWANYQKNLADADAEAAAIASAGDDDDAEQFGDDDDSVGDDDDFGDDDDGASDDAIRLAAPDRKDLEIPAARTVQAPRRKQTADEFFAGSQYQTKGDQRRFRKVAKNMNPDDPGQHPRWGQTYTSDAGDQYAYGYKEPIAFAGGDMDLDHPYYEEIVGQGDYDVVEPTLGSSRPEVAVSSVDTPGDVPTSPPDLTQKQYVRGAHRAAQADPEFKGPRTPWVPPKKAKQYRQDYASKYTPELGPEEPPKRPPAPQLQESLMINRWAKLAGLLKD
tara:strand:- start:2221 stop:4815 length:2595 start_codon:yes stop_codon:yes gene_type:complete